VKDALNAEYDAMRAGGFVDRILSSQRRKMFEAFMLFKQKAAAGSILNLYMKPTSLFDNSNYLDAWSSPQERARITSYPLMVPKMQPAAAYRLPFADNAFDWVFCNEVIEHTGTAERQGVFMGELYRVTRRGIFATTSNRLHPIEFKTGLPFIHLLPHAWWQRLLAWSGKREWAQPDMLTLVDAPTLYLLARQLPGAPQHEVGHKRVFGIKAHFFLMIQKADA